MTKLFVVFAYVLAAANAAKIFYAPGCNTNADNAANYAPGGALLASTGGTPRTSDQIPQDLQFGASDAVVVNFPAGDYAVGGVSFPDGVGLTFVDNSHLDFVGAASGPPAVMVAGMAPKAECDITCHTNYRDGLASDASNDLSLLPVSTSPISTSDSLIFPQGYNYILEAHGALVAAGSLSWKGSQVPSGPWMPPCNEVTPCHSDRIPLLSMIGSGANSAFVSLYGASAISSFTSCPARTTSPPGMALHVIPQSELTQINMRRVGVQTSSAARLVQLESGTLASMCRRNPSITCPTSVGPAQTLMVDVTGYRPRSDLAVMTLSAQMAALQSHIVAYLNLNLGEIRNFAISNATYSQATGNQLRLEVTYNVGGSTGISTDLLTSVLQELVGTFTTATLGPCVSLANGLDSPCITTALQAAFQTAYDGTNTMLQVEEALRAEYARARGCTIAELSAGACSVNFTTSLTAAETYSRDRRIATIIAGSTTASPTTASPTSAPLAAGVTAAPVLAPTSLAPVTNVPTTQPPVTSAPTTAAPVTFAPTTTNQAGQPTSLAPTSLAPTTPAPFTHAPTTQAPVTFAPTTLAPAPGVAASSTDGSSGGSLLGLDPLYAYILFAVIAILVVGIAAFVLTQNSGSDASAGAAESGAAGVVVAFENPMYDTNSPQTQPVESFADDTYDEPKYAAGLEDQPMYASNDDDDDDEVDDANMGAAPPGGYIDVQEAEEDTSGMYADTAIEGDEALYDDGVDAGNDEDDDDI